MAPHILPAIIVLLLISAASSLRAWAHRADLLTAVCFLLSWTSTACLTAYALQGLGAATLTWFFAPPYAVLLLWALEPTESRTEAPGRPCIVPPEPLVHPSPMANWQDETAWLTEDDVPTVRTKGYPRL